MALNIADLADRKAELKFDFAGDVVRIEYYPHKITPIYMARLQAIGKKTEEDEGGDGSDVSGDSKIDPKEDRQSADAQMVSDLLVSWDVMAGNDPFPPTYENLLTAPTSLVSRVVAEIVTAVGKLATPRSAKH